MTNKDRQNLRTIEMGLEIHKEHLEKHHKEPTLSEQPTAFECIDYGRHMLANQEIEWLKNMISAVKEMLEK